MAAEVDDRLNPLFPPNFNPVSGCRILWAKKKILLCVFLELFVAFGEGKGLGFTRQVFAKPVSTISCTVFHLVPDANSIQQVSFLRRFTRLSKNKQATVQSHSSTQCSFGYWGRSIWNPREYRSLGGGKGYEFIFDRFMA